MKANDKVEWNFRQLRREISVSHILLQRRLILKKSRGFVFLISFIFVNTLPSLSSAHEFHAFTQNHHCIYGESRSKAVAIIMRGKISRGMAAALEEKIFSVRDRIAEYNLSSQEQYKLCDIEFQSAGGDVYEAMEIGRVIRRNRLTTKATYKDSYCYSACVLAFSGGVFRMAFDDKIGIHSFYSPSFIGTDDYEQNELFFNKVYNDVETFLREMRVPRAILDQMVSTSFQHLRHLKLKDLTEIGFLGFDPVYDQVTPRAP